MLSVFGDGGGYLSLGCALSFVVQGQLSCTAALEFVPCAKLLQPCHRSGHRTWLGILWLCACDSPIFSRKRVAWSVRYLVEILIVTIEFFLGSMCRESDDSVKIDMHFITCIHLLFSFNVHVNLHVFICVRVIRLYFVLATLLFYFQCI